MKYSKKVNYTKLLPRIKRPGRPYETNEGKGKKEQGKTKGYPVHSGGTMRPEVDEYM